MESFIFAAVKNTHICKSEKQLLLLLCFFYINHNEQNKDTKQKSLYIFFSLQFFKINKILYLSRRIPSRAELECVSQGWVRIKRIHSTQ